MVLPTARCGEQTPAEEREAAVRLSLITDEVSPDLDAALRVCDELGVGTVELRGVGGRNVVEHDAASLRRIAASLHAGGFRCRVVDSPFFKEQPRWEALERAIEAAGALDASVVRVFSGSRPPAEANGAATDAAFARAAEVLDEAAARVAAAGLDIALEIEFVCAVATGTEAARLLGMLDGRALGLVWDPGNEARFTGRRPDPDGQAAVKDRIAHVHVKDVAPDGAWIRVGDGLVDWGDQLRRLADDGYEGLLALETHYADPDGGLPAATRACAAALRGLALDAGVALG